MNKSQNNLIFRIIQIATVCVFAGRAWQHLFWDAPYRELLWDENWMSGIVTFFTDMTWKEYVTSPNGNTFIENLIRSTGWLYLICGLIAIWIRKLPRFIHYILLFGAFNLVFLAILYSKEKFFHIGQFLEYTLQFGSPVFLYLVVNQLIKKERLILILKFSIVLTFTCHGLYALAYYPRPESFFYMTSSILGLTQTQAVLFLNIVGVLDFVIAIGIFLPRKISIPVLVYAIFWGFMTSIARIWANFYPDFWMESLHQWTHETIMRCPHFLIPLALFFLIRKD